MTERERVLAEVRAQGLTEEFAHRLLWLLTNESATPYASAIEVDCCAEGWDGPGVVLALLEATDEQLREALRVARREGSIL